MAPPPNKRRKMRPNNAIALERAKQESILKESTQRKNTKSSSSVYSSASDSDETDNEATPLKKKKKVHPKEEQDDQDVGDSSADESNTNVSNTKESAEAEAATATATAAAAAAAAASASDSDETDEEIIKHESADEEMNLKSSKSTTPPVSSRSTPDLSKYKTEQFVQEESSDEEQEADANSTANTTTNTNTATATATTTAATTTTNTNADSDSVAKPDPEAAATTSNAENGRFRQSVTKREHLVGNRLSFRRRAEYDNNKSAAMNLSKRLNDSFLPNVQQDYFVSDSDSEPDSGEDYENKEYPTWQRTMSWNRKPDEDPWPKQRKFGYSDKLKLEKRIKKICRRENMSFSDAQEIFSSSKRKEHLRFFQKIAAVFPNVPLYLLVKRLKETYHIKRNSSPWSKEEIKQLEELLKIHGNNAELVSTMMNRSPKNINDFIFNHKTASKAATRWSKEEDEYLAKMMAKEKKNASGRVSFASVEPYFKGQRSQKQIYARYYNIRHRIQPDGTLAENRLATPVEELEYLQSLLKQVNDHGLIEESQLDFARDRGYVKPNFYLNNRTNVTGFEKMPIKDILNILISKQERIVESRKAEDL